MGLCISITDSQITDQNRQLDDETEEEKRKKKREQQHTRIIDQEPMIGNYQTCTPRPSAPTTDSTTCCSYYCGCLCCDDCEGNDTTGNFNTNHYYDTDHFGFGNGDTNHSRIDDGGDCCVGNSSDGGHCGGGGNDGGDGDCGGGDGGGGDCGDCGGGCDD